TPAAALGRRRGRGCGGRPAARPPGRAWDHARLDLEHRLSGDAVPAGGGRGGGAALPAVRPGPGHQPHPDLRTADGAARSRLHRGRSRARTAPPLGAQPRQRARPCPWPRPPGPRRPRSRPCATGSRTSSTGASTAAATTPPAPWRRWPPGPAARSARTPSPPSGGYDPAATWAGSAARRRAQVDLDALHTERLPVVDETVQPTRASLWLRG